VPGVALTVVQGDPAREPALSCASAAGQQPGTVLTDATGTATCHLRFDGQPGESTYQMKIGGAWRVLPAFRIGFTVTRGHAYTFALIGGNGQVGTAGTALPARLVAQLKDPSGAGIPNAAVSWDVPLGGGTLSGTSYTTDELGRVSTAFTPTSAGAVQVRVRLSSQPSVQATFAVSASPPAAPPCSIVISPTAVSAPAGGLAASVNVSAGLFGCPWTAASNTSWISLTGAASGTASAVVNFTVAANNGAARTGTIAIGGHTIMVTQGAIESATERFVSLIYQNFFGRVPTAAEMAEIVNALNRGLSRAEFIENLLNLEEYRARLTTGGLYQTVLRRAPTAAEQQAMIAQLLTGTSVRSLADTLLNSAEFQALLQ
jgi:hypothetical protein